MTQESRFTRPRPDCPYPDRWHSTDDDSTEIEVSQLVGAFITALQPDYVVETGTAFGQTAYWIGHALRNNGQGRLDTIEPDPSRAETSRKRCAGLPVEVHETTSLEFTPAHEIDFAWFDSLIHLRAKEFRRYLPRMSKRAVVGFHDTGPQHQTRKYLDQLIGAGLVNHPIWLPTPRGVVFARVRGGIW